MEPNSEKQEDTTEKSLEYATAKEKQLRALDEKCTYFDCKICSMTVSRMESNNECHDAENIDPNAPHSGVCKSCLANQTFHKSLPTEQHFNQSTSSNRPSEGSNDRAANYKGYAAGGGDDDSSSPAILSPLTTTPSTSSATTSVINNRPSKVEEGFFSVGKSHRVVLSAKPPAHKTGNYAGMNLYLSQNVFDPDFERLFNNEEANDRRIDKFFAGVDVIYKRDDRKTYTCEPLLCPAKVFYYDPSSSKTECEVVVGIIFDGHNSAYPIVGVYDSFRNLKNLSKSRSAIHGMFSRNQPTSIQHDFSAEELSCFTKHLFAFLNVRSSLEEKEGNTLLIS